MIPDITTPEGRAVVEERIMRAMGAVGVVADDDWDRHVGWVLDIDDEPRLVPFGWLYTGDGMVSAKRHFAVTRHWRVRSWQGVGGTGYAVLQGDDGIEAAAFDCEQGEPFAVAVVLYKAAQRAAVEDSYTQGRRDERERIVRLLRDQIRETPVGQYATSALSEAIRRIEEGNP